MTTDSFSHEPKRLLDSSAGGGSEGGLEATLRRDLELVRQSSVAYPVEAGLARFEATLAGAATVPAGGTIAGTSVLRWFIGGSTLLGLGVVAVLLLGDRGSLPQPAGALARAPAQGQLGSAHHEFRSEDNEVAAPTSSGAGTTQERSASTRESVAGSGLAGVDGDAGARERAEGGSPVHAVATSPRPTPKSSPKSSGEPSVAAIADEAKQIDAARKALADDPAKTLELTEKAEQEFPKGTMIQERRGYAILALIALDRRDEAEERADRYLERWPKGPLSHRIREALGR